MSQLDDHRKLRLAGSLPARSGLRLTFPLRRAARGEMDGRWWPRTRDPEVELPAMITAVTVEYGAVDQVDLDPDAWDGRPRTLTVDDRVIRLNWFGTRERHTIGLVCRDSSRLDLLMIPPDTATVVAVACLTMAARAGTCSGSPSGHPG